MLHHDALSFERFENFYDDELGNTPGEPTAINVDPTIGVMPFAGIMETQ
jgi:hypothetical protein